MKKPVVGSARSDLALRASEERLRLVMKATSDGLWDWRVATGELYFTDPAAGGRSEVVNKCA